MLFSLDGLGRGLILLSESTDSMEASILFGILVTLWKSFRVHLEILTLSSFSTFPGEVTIILAFMVVSELDLDTKDGNWAS